MQGRAVMLNCFTKMAFRDQGVKAKVIPILERYKDNWDEDLQ